MRDYLKAQAALFTCLLALLISGITHGATAWAQDDDPSVTPIPTHVFAMKTKAALLIPRNDTATYPHMQIFPFAGESRAVLTGHKLVIKIGELESPNGNGTATVVVDNPLEVLNSRRFRGNAKARVSLATGAHSYDFKLRLRGNIFRVRPRPTPGDVTPDPDVVRPRLGIRGRFFGVIPPITTDDDNARRWPRAIFIGAFRGFEVFPPPPIDGDGNEE